MEDISKLPCVQKETCTSPEKLISGVEAVVNGKTATFKCKEDNFDLLAENIQRTKELKATCTSDLPGKLPYWKFDDHDLKVRFHKLFLVTYFSYFHRILLVYSAQIGLNVKQLQIHLQIMEI